MRNQTLGQDGEKLAVEKLKESGYEILETNYFTRLGEIDIIARCQKMLCFVEVKTRKSLRYGDPLLAITEAKKRHMIRAAEHYLQEYPELKPEEIRFDVVAVVFEENNFKIEWRKGVF